MKTVSTKLLSLLLVAILLVSAIPFQAFAADMQPEEQNLEEQNPQGQNLEGQNLEEQNPGAPAAQSNDVLPFAHTATHDLSELKYDGTYHWQECMEMGCEYEGKAVPITKVAHTYDSTGKCTCGAECPHTSTVLKNVVDPTCLSDGEAHKFCQACGQDLVNLNLQDAQTVPAPGHSFVNGECTICHTKESTVNPGTAYTLTLNANGGTFEGGGTTYGIPVNQGKIIGYMPPATNGGFKFLGWYLADNVTKVDAADYYTYGQDITVYAKWETITQRLIVNRVLNNDFKNAKEILNVNVPEGTLLLDYLENNVKTVVRQNDVLTPGYRWEDDEAWLDYSGNRLYITQTDRMNQAWTVYVRFVPETYTLYFNPNGGTVTPASKTVSFGASVGTLPTPYLQGKVFQGWKDENGVKYTADTVYSVDGDTSLTAEWLDEVKVMLNVYINGDFTRPDRLMIMDGFVKNNTLSRADVFAELQRYYVPASGTLSIAGLFDDSTWSSYRTNTSKAGIDYMPINADGTKAVYVMVNNAKTGATVIDGGSSTTSTNGFYIQSPNGVLTWYPAGSTLPTGSGYWIYDTNGNPYIWVVTGYSSIIPSYIYTYFGTNPKTGDTAKIEIAVVVLVVAAVALIAVMILRKKKKSE